MYRDNQITNSRISSTHHKIEPQLLPSLQLAIPATSHVRMRVTETQEIQNKSNQTLSKRKNTRVQLPKIHIPVQKCPIKMSPQNVQNANSDLPPIMSEFTKSITTIKQKKCERNTTNKTSSVACTWKAYHATSRKVCIHNLTNHCPSST